MPGRAREVDGRVIEALPKALYRVELDGQRHVLAHLTGDRRRNFIRVLVGDRVRVALAPNDVTRGRITHRY
ncbi:MAG: translation initiation factor IF-1 [Acidobacteria bacterium]|nr:translation initiation factor IF-1 [Acidobacteriota bacterium]